MGGKGSKARTTYPGAYGPYGPYGPRRAPPNIPPYFPTGRAVAPTYTYPGYAGNSALALDAADGVIDGRHFGSPIVGGGYAAPAFAPTITRSVIATPATVAAPLTTYSPGLYSSPYASSSALALDAADGVIDGRHFGRPIVGGASYGATTFASPFTSFASPFASPYASSSALALDAADGVIDGRHFGAPIVGGASFAAPAFASSVVAPPVFSSFAPSVVSPFAASPFASSSALALDAADGVIDGRYFGSPIAGGVSSFAAPAFASSVVAAPAFAPSYAPTFAPALSAPVVSSYVAPSVVSPFAASPFAPSFASPFASSSALALDAADGVIDGRHFGRPIVGGASFAPTFTSFGAPAFAAPVTSFSPFGNSSALALDAADGVIDGRFFGSPIAQPSPFLGASVVAPAPVVL